MTPASATFVLTEISRERNRDMLKILEESPIETPWLTVRFDHAPDIFVLPELFSERVVWAGALKGEELAGYAMMAYQRRYVDGEPRLVTYFGNAHVRREDRGQGLTSRMGERLFRGRDERADIGYAIVMTGNRPAERFIGRRPPGCPDLPPSRTIGSLCARNILILGRKRESAGFHVRRATVADVDAMVALLQAEFRHRLFGPILDKDAFLLNAGARPGCALEDHYVAVKDGEIVGTCAAWDMGPLRQTRIIRFGTELRLAKAAHAVWAPLAGSPAWPREGERIKDITITDCAVRGRDPEILEALLRRIYNELRPRGYMMMTFGSCRDDPLLQATRPFLSYPVISNIVLYAKDPALLADGHFDTSLPYVDLAMV